MGVGCRLNKKYDKMYSHYDPSYTEDVESRIGQNAEIGIIQQLPARFEDCHNLGLFRESAFLFKGLCILCSR